MKKKLLASFLVIILLFPSLSSSTSYAADGRNIENYSVSQDMVEVLQDKYENIGEFLEDNFTNDEIDKIKKEYTQEYGKTLDMDESITPMGLGFLATVLAGALGIIIAAVTMSTFSSAVTWLKNRIEKDGGIASCDQVKVSGQTFNPTFRSNWVGTGYANDRNRVKAVQEYSNRAKVTNTIVVDGIHGFSTDRSIRTLQIKLGLYVDGVVGTGTWMAMGGRKCS